MTRPAQEKLHLVGQTSAGVDSETTLEVEAVGGAIMRSAGLVGDSLRVLVNPDDLWPEDWDLSKSMKIVIGDEDEEVAPGGYYLGGIGYTSAGEPIGGGTAVMQQAVLSLTTVIERMMEGRGGLLTSGTLNRLGRDGQPDTSDDDYYTLEELIQIAAGVVTGPGSGWDLTLSIINGASLADTTPGGPYDWANVRALPELNDLLAKIGWTASLTTDGTTLRVYRLPRPGEAISLPTIVTANAEPYVLDDTPANRSKYIIVTSGRTRTTVLTRRDIADLEFVYYDERTNSWLNQTQHAALYSGEIGPDDINGLKGGPYTDPEKNAELNRVFGALRLKNDPEGLSDLRNAGRFVVLNGEFEFDGKRMSGTPAFIEAKFCVEGDEGQFTNSPIDPEEDPIRVDVSALAGDGVVLLPNRKGEPLMARVDTTGLDTETTSYSSLRKLATGELTLYFAHESDTGDLDLDYARAVFRVDEVEGEFLAVLVTDGPERDAAIADPNSVVIEQSSIRRVVQWEPGDLAVTELNDTELLEVMQQYAQIRAGAELVKSGQIELNGFFDISPGDAGGAITSVVYDLGRRKTIVVINQHEVPQSMFTMLEQRTQRSLASGLGRFRLPGSSAGVLDVRAGSSPGDAASLPANAGLGTSELDPAQGSATRGADQASGTRRAVRSFTPRRHERFNLHSIYAVVTSSAPISGSTNRWIYDWAQVELATPGSAIKKGRTSATIGKAYNRAEYGDTESGVQSDGVNRDNLPGTYARKPIGEGRVVKLEGPVFDVNGTAYWTFYATNHYDGDCEDPE
jgi:hypothetical protein